jgi:ComF family protein
MRLDDAMAEPLAAGPRADTDGARAAAPATPPMGWRTVLGGIASTAADLLLPAVCIGCRAPVDRQGQLCGACGGKIDFIGAPLCDRLGIPLPFDTGERSWSAAAIAAPPAYDRARAVARYSSTMRDLVQSFKYRDRHESLPLFGRWLVKAGEELLPETELLIPVPLHRAKLWSRRFNQSALLAARVGRASGIPVAYSLLQRVKRTSRQVGLTAEQRRRNVAGAFRVAPQAGNRLKGKRVLLVDDVITTGATVEACARALRRAGAVRIDVLALARVVEPAAFSL